MDKAIYWAFFIVIAFGLFFWYMVAHSMYDLTKEKQRAFATDGCTMFVNGSWKECCIAHDHDYWQGGSAETRQESDERFKECIYTKTQNRPLSLGAYMIIRIGGVPYLATPWRWGYGWSFGKEYR
jgi:hypothetical protein